MFAVLKILLGSSFVPETLMYWIGQEVHSGLPAPVPEWTFWPAPCFKALLSLGDRNHFYVHFTDEETEA